VGGQSRNNQDRCCGQISWLSEGSTLLGYRTNQGACAGARGQRFIVQRRERSHGRGIPEHPMRPTAGRRPFVDRESPGRKNGHAMNLRMRVCSPTSRATLLPLRDHGTTTSPAFWRGWVALRSEVDNGHKRVCKIALRGLAACATARCDSAHAVGREPRGCTPYETAFMTPL
jgi:hypothetical protein